jgi:hypothetical protein
MLHKAIDSLILSIELFNRPSNNGRIHSVLILLDHSFEMLLKSAIINKGGKIREKNKNETIGFDACIRKGISDSKIQFLSDDQAITLQTINGLRDAAQHHLLDISETQLYLHVQSGVTLFNDLLNLVFSKKLNDYLPNRVLPVSSIAPMDIITLFENETKEIEKLLNPKKKKKTEAFARIRPLAILDATIQGKKLQPSDSELSSIAKGIVSKIPLAELFPGVFSIDFSFDKEGAKINLRITKKEGIPINIVPEGTPGASVVALKRVNELDYYSLNCTQIAKKIGITLPKTVAIIRYLKIQNDDKYYKEINIGKSRFKRYSNIALQYIKEKIREIDIDEIWKVITKTILK